MEMKDMISGDWVKIDLENKITEITFSKQDELIAKMTFDFANDKHSVEGDLSKVTEQDDNDDFVKTYEECSRQILKIS